MFVLQAQAGFQLDLSGECLKDFSEPNALLTPPVCRVRARQHTMFAQCSLGSEGALCKEPRDAHNSAGLRCAPLPTEYSRSDSHSVVEYPPLVSSSHLSLRSSPSVSAASCGGGGVGVGVRVVGVGVVRVGGGVGWSRGGRGVGWKAGFSRFFTHSIGSSTGEFTASLHLAVTFRVQTLVTNELLQK